MTDEKRPDAAEQIPANEASAAGENPSDLEEQQPESSRAEDVPPDDLPSEEVPPEDNPPPADSPPADPVEVEDGPAPPVAPAPVKPKGRVFAVLAFLIALLAVGGVGYLYYLLVYLQPLEDVRSQNNRLAQEYTQIQSGIESQLAALSRETTTALDAASAEQAERLAENQDAVLKSLQEALSAAPPSQREWKMAEAEYLLRIANHRVLMEQDSTGALQLLQAADQIMAELDDFALHQVRARLADEIIALRQVRRDDVQGIYLRLEAIKSQLDSLPLPQPEYLQGVDEQQSEESVWATLLDEMKQFVRVRSLNSQEALQPLLAPEEIRYLELNLRLALEQAQLATLKRQQEVYEQSLLNVRRWLVDHADIEDSRTKALLETVDELLLFELARPLPEISGSLTELLNVRRGGA